MRRYRAGRKIPITSKSGQRSVRGYNTPSRLLYDEYARCSSIVEHKELTNTFVTACPLHMRSIGVVNILKTLTPTTA